VQPAAETNTDVPFEHRPRLVRRTIAAGLGIAVIGSFVAAVAEMLAAACFIVIQGNGEALPLGLVAAALGRTAITHLLVWCPLLLIIALVVSALRRRKAGPSDPLLWAVFVLIAGLVVVLADLVRADKTSWLILIGACAGVVVLSLVTYVVVRVLRRRLGTTRLGRLRNAVACVCALLMVVFGATLVPSPLYSADRYRAQPPAAATSAPTRPNVLWIVLDTARADLMSCYGYDSPTTPFLEEWAQSAIVFDRAVADGIWTVPSHASMFTGLSVRQHGAHNGNLWLDDETTTVAEVLKANGYATGAFVNNHLVSAESNLVQGFDVARLVCHWNPLTGFSLEYLCERAGVTPLVPWLDGDFSAALTNQLAARWLDDLPDDGTPFLLFVNYMEAHLPYRVPKRYRRMYMNERQVHRSYDLRYRAFGNIVPALGMRYDTEGGGFVSPEDRQVARLQHLATIRYLDDRVREIIDLVDRRGSLEDTLVIITSDHGEYLDAHGMWAHRFQTYNEITRVCLLVREPGRRSGIRIRVPVQVSDLYPTVVNLALGTSGPGPGHGTQDLIAVAEAAPPSRIAISEFCGAGSNLDIDLLGRQDAELDRRAQPQIAATDGRFKYIISGDGRRELYNLLRDPGEQHNVITVFPSQVKRLAAHISSWQKVVPRHQPPASGAASQMSEKTRQALRALGYLADE